MGKQTGASLVETMVALFVLAIGLLGVLAMQVKGMQYNQSAYSYTQAVYLASDLAERVRSNIGLQRAELNRYALAETLLDPATAEEPQVGCQPCSPAERAQADLAQWQWRVAKELPGPSAAVQLVTADGGQPQLVISVGFDDSRSAGAIAANDTSGRQRYHLTLEI